jgi:Bifunctional DNA primase/polymerase, N-terminal
MSCAQSEPGTPAALRKAAHEYADRGWPVFPCQPGGKAPACEHGYQDATVSHARIDWWWTRTWGANIAIATGSPGPDVLDIDIHPGRSGFAALRRARRAGLIPVPVTTVRSPGGGIHLYYPGTSQRCGCLPLSAIDFRGRGGSIIAPPSWSGQHRRHYQLLDSRNGSGPIAWDPIRGLLQPPAPPRRLLAAAIAGDDRGLVGRLAAWLETRPEGNRNYPLYWAARLVAASGLMDQAARERLITASIASGLRGGEREARATLASGERAGSRSAAPPPRLPSARTSGPGRESR